MGDVEIPKHPSDGAGEAEAARLRRVGIGLALLLFGCVSMSLQRTSTRPATFEEIERACRDRAAYYKQPAPVFVQCMRDEGFRNVTAADY